MNQFRLILSLLLLSTIPASFSQDVTDTVTCRLCKNNIHTSQPPFNFGWKHEIPFIASAVVIGGTGVILQETNSVKPLTIPELAGVSRDDVNGFDRGATYNWSERASDISDVFLAGALVAPALFLTNKPTRNDFGWLALMSWEVLSVNYGVTYTVKNLTNRNRPYVYNPQVPLEVRTGNDSRESFFSGHVSTTATMSFFMATVLCNYHPEMKTGIKISMWSIAALYPAVTGYLRIRAGKHYPTDVIAAYAAGALTGWLVPFLHRKKKREGKFSIAPVNIQGNAGLYMSLKF